MIPVDLAGHAAYVVVIAGTFLVRSHHKTGWALRALGHAAWIAIGVHLGLTSIWLWETIFVAQDVEAWYRWR